MTEIGSGEGKTRPEEVAAYIAVMSAEMARLARNNKLLTLAYLLEVARMEAGEHAKPANEAESQRIA